MSKTRVREAEIGFLLWVPFFADLLLVVTRLPSTYGQGLTIAWKFA